MNATLGPLEFVVATFYLVMSITSFHGIGGWVWSQVRLTKHEQWLSSILRIGTGMFIFSLWVFVTGAALPLNDLFLIGFLMTGLILEVYSEHNTVELIVGVHRLYKRLAILDRGLLTLFVIMASVSFFAACTPPIGNDSLSYHLYLPKWYLDTGYVTHDPWHTRSLWPLMMSSIYTSGLVLQGTVLAKQFSWLTAILGVLLVPAAVHAFGGHKRQVRTAFIFMISVPVIWMQSMYAYVDLAVMFYTFAALVVLWLWKEHHFALRPGVAVGVMVAALVSIKLHALYSVVLFLIIFGIALTRARLERNQKVIAVAVPIVVCALLSGFWFVRSYMHTGNPLFPFLAEFFGGAGFSQRMVGFAVLPKNALNLLLLPWNVAIRVDIFGGEVLGVLFLAALPSLLFLKHLKGFARAALLFGVGYLIIWFYTIQITRFLLPALPALSVAFAFLVCELNKHLHHFRKILQGLLVVIIVIQMGIALYYPLRVMKGFLKHGSFEYLRRYERSYAFLERVGQEVGEEDKILFLGESRLLYAPVRSIVMSPLIGLRLREQNITFNEWLKQQGIRYLVTRSPEAQVTWSDFLSKDEHIKGRVREVFNQRVTVEGTHYYRLWKVEA